MVLIRLKRWWLKKKYPEEFAILDEVVEKVRAVVPDADAEVGVHVVSDGSPEWDQEAQQWKVRTRLRLESGALILLLSGRGGAELEVATIKERLTEPDYAGSYYALTYGKMVSE